MLHFIKIPITSDLNKFGFQVFAGHEIHVLQVYIHSYGRRRQAHGPAWRTSGNLVKIDGHLEICENARRAINEVASVIDRASSIREYSSGAKLFSTIYAGAFHV